MLQFHLANTPKGMRQEQIITAGLISQIISEDMFDCWLDPCSLAASKGILVSFFSLRLLICLSSARSLAWAEVKKENQKKSMKRKKLNANTHVNRHEQQS